MAGCATRQCFRRERGSRNVDIARRREGCACPSAPPLSTAAPPVRHEQATSAGMADRTGLVLPRRALPTTEGASRLRGPSPAPIVRHRLNRPWWPIRPSPERAAGVLHGPGRCHPVARAHSHRCREAATGVVVPSSKAPRSCLGGWCNRRVARVAPAGSVRDGAASPERIPRPCGSIPCPCGKGPALLLRPPRRSRRLPLGAFPRPWYGAWYSARYGTRAAPASGRIRTPPEAVRDAVVGSRTVPETPPTIRRAPIPGRGLRR